MIRVCQFAALLSCAVTFASAADDAYMREQSRQRLSAVSADIRKTAAEENAKLVRGSVRLLVFGPEATVALYALEGAQGTAQFMVALESQTDTDAAEVGPAIESANLVFHRYPTKQVVIGHARIGGQGWRNLDLAHAVVDEERNEHFELLANVRLPIEGEPAAVVYRVSRAYGEQTATIAER